MLYCACYNLLLLNLDTNLVGNLETRILADILDSINQLACHTFTTQLICNGNIQRNGKYKMFFAENIEEQKVVTLSLIVMVPVIIRKKVLE